MNRESDDDKLLLALAHAMRRAILREMPEDVLVSPSEMAPKLEDTISNISYHFRMLARGSAVELAEERQVRGATQHFYRKSLKPDWARKMLEEPEG
jgi:DNA-binding transcriptional ArsR family regulator